MSLVIGTWHRMAFYEPVTQEKVKQKTLMHHSRQTAKLTSKRDFELDLCSKAWALEKHKANNGGLFASKPKIIQILK